MMNRILGATIVLVLALAGCATESSSTTPATMERVIDGDTLEVTTIRDGEAIRVRLLAIDAPEVGACGSEDAARRLAEVVPEGTPDLVVSDPKTAQTDRYDRLLAYVETNQVGDVGALLVGEGLVGVWWPSQEPVPTRADSYSRLLEHARANAVGSWPQCGDLGR